MTPAMFPSPGPAGAAGTAAGGTLILFGCVPFSAANLAGAVTSQRVRIGRWVGGPTILPRGSFPTVHHLKLIPSFFGAYCSEQLFRFFSDRLPAPFVIHSKPPSLCQVQPDTKEFADVQKAFARGAKNVG